jgi:uncharacterized membrane protein
VPQNNRAFAFTQVRSVPGVLIISSDPAADASLAHALQSPDLRVTLAGKDQFPDSLAELQSYDSIIFSNISGGDLAHGQQEILESAVRDFGTGFVCIGGDETYAAGAYRGTRLAEMLPVNVELSSKKVLPPGALMLVIDRSGSMAGDKLEMAKEAAAAAVKALAPNDYVGVIAFDDAPQIVVPIQKAEKYEDIIQRILSIGTGGGTAMYPPMEAAYGMLRNNPGSFKHCILLTDGVSASGDFEGITRSMVANRITVSTVAIGGDADTKLLQSIAQTGQGRFYPASNAQQLPQIFIKETAVVLKSAISEEVFTPQLVFPSEPIRGIGPYPPLKGYVVTEPKERAETPLLTDKGDPLLAHWQFGLGRIAAFTSDARAKWAQSWLLWNQYQQFWRQIIQWSLRRIENNDLSAVITTEHGEGRISVEALDAENNFRNFLDLQALVLDPSREKQRLALKQTGPGHYEAVFPMRVPGAYLVNILRFKNGKLQSSQTAGASLNYSPELDASAPNLNLLRRIAESTGGKVIDPSRQGSNPFFDDRRRTWQPHDLWENFLRAAILLFVVDVGLRRIHLDREQLARAWALVFGFVKLGEGKKKRIIREDTTLTMLLARRTENQLPSTSALSISSLRPTDERFKTDVSTEPQYQEFSREDIPLETKAAGSITASRLLEAKRRIKRREGQTRTDT